MEQVGKAELLQKIAESSGCPPETAELVWSGFVQVLPGLLQESESIDLGEEIGKLVVRDRPEGHGGSTHRSLKKRRKMAFFKASSALERQLVQSDEEFFDMLLQQGQTAHAEEVRRGILARNQTKK